MWSAAEALRRIERRLEMMAGTGTQTEMHAQALRHIERRLEMMIGAGTAVHELETKLNSVYTQEVQLDSRSMQDDGDLLPQIKHNIGQKTASSSFHGLQHLHSDPKCVLLCSSGAHRCDCSRPGRFLCM